MGTIECSQPTSKSSWDSQDFGDISMVLKMAHFRKSTGPQWVKYIQRLPHSPPLTGTGPLILTNQRTGNSQARDCFWHGDDAAHIFDQNSNNVQFLWPKPLKNYWKRRHAGNTLFWTWNSHFNFVNLRVMSADCQNQRRHQACQKRTHAIRRCTKRYKPRRYTIYI